MPRQSNLARNSHGARRHNLKRKNESTEEKQTRLKTLRETRNARRSLETLRVNSNLWLEKEFSAMHYNANIDYKNDPIIALGSMSVICQFCLAKKFKDEPIGMCCLRGKIYLNEILPPPEPLYSLLTGNHPKSSHFKKNIRQYNNSFQMTSFNSKKINLPGYMPTFKVQGQVYHLAGSLFPESENDHKFLQIYFISDAEKQTSVRCSRAAEAVDRNLIRILQDMLHQHNNYVKSFKSAIESVPHNVPDFQIIIHSEKVPHGDHPGRYNAPTTNEVAILITGQQFNKRDIVLKARDNNIIRISELHRSYDSLQYPLMFCRGEDGYSIQIKQVDPISRNCISKNVSCMNFYCYRLMIRENMFNPLHMYGTLLNQYLVDQYAKIESERLAFIRNNQNMLRVESYTHLKDALHANEDPNQIGQLVILPSTFTGGPRYLHEKTQDAMTYVRKYGKPDLFITFTCNPQWKEIKDNLGTSTLPQERYDIVNRIFNIKILKLLYLINKVKIFGPTLCHMYTVEWQKRGLPHVHLLLWLKSKIQADQIDSIISAELPSVDEDAELYALVQKHMIHGPCGSYNCNSPCMHENKCSKNYPKSFQTNTSCGSDGYPKYRRLSPEEGGKTTEIRNHTIDNRWVVPYNSLLLKIFDAHINVELCSSVKSIKYVCKYINKGSDQATFSVGASDEIREFVSGRYICTSEALWRIFSFDIHDRFPTIVHLAVHLENGQRVYFNKNNINNIIDNPPITTLTAFFHLCQNDSFAKTLFYNELPAYYTWNAPTKKFQRRKNGLSVEGFENVKKCSALGRVYVVHPNNTECFYLRILLHKIKGPTSFDFLKTVNGVILPSYQAACRALGLLEDDKHWEQTLLEASFSSSAKSLRYLFAIILCFCQVSDSINLWTKYRENMSDDLLHIKRVAMNLPNLDFNQDIFDEALCDLNKIVFSLTGKQITEFQLTLPSNINEQNIFEDERSYDKNALLVTVAKNVPRLNSDQTIVYNEIIASVEQKKGRMFFLDAPGGTGKTFLINLLLAKVRSSGGIAIAVASSGIAATLLDGGKTAHSTFKLPLKISGTDSSICSICNISKQSNIAKLMRDCSLIVWDEATMAHKVSIEALDKSLRDLRNKNKPMGSCTVLFSGDFRQTLPIVVRGTRADEVDACLKKSHLWPQIKSVTLKKNMRLSLCPDNEKFANKLLDIGNGKIISDRGLIRIDESLCVPVNDLEELIKNVFPCIDNISQKI